jgi:hypothetical protein
MNLTSRAAGTALEVLGDGVQHRGIVQEDLAAGRRAIPTPLRTFVWIITNETY